MMQRTSSPIPRSHQQRAYSSEQYSTASHGSYDQDSLGLGSGGGGGVDTSFELMSATQLRDQLRKEQYRRRESQAEVEALKGTAGLLRVDTSRQATPARSYDASRHISPVKTYEYATPNSNGQDSDSGISHTRTKSSYASQQHHTPAANIHFNLGTSSRGGHLPLRTPPSISIPQAQEPWSLSATSGAIKDMQDAMYESEQRRLVLVEKLREAHETLQIQTERLCESEAKLNDSQYTMENISTSNQTLQRKLSSIQRDREDTMAEKMKTIQQRQVMESKVEDLDRDLKNMRLAYTALQAEHNKRDLIVEQTSRALTLVEEENHKFQQTKGSMLKEAIALRESLHMSKAKCDKLEAEIADLAQVREDREILVARNSELNVKMQEAQHSNSHLDHENELLKGDFHKAREEREVFQTRAIQLEEKCADLNAKCVSSAVTKEKLLQEKLDLQQLLNQSNHEREQVSKARQLLENQITDMQLDVTQSKLAVETKEEDMERLMEELNAVKKVSEVLSTELSTAKQNVERLQEEMREVTTDKRTSQQQQAYWQEEANRLTGEKESVSKALEQQKEEFNKERDQLNEQYQTIKENLKEIRAEKTKAQSRCQELETMLQRANDEIETCVLRHQEEMEEWRSSCDRLTQSVGRKDNETAMLAEHLEMAQNEVAQFKAELLAARQKHEQLLEERDEMDQLREDNKRLTQEHGEDQQVIHLLEMQKNILAKNQASTQHRQTADQLQAQVDHLKAELGLAEDRTSEAKEELVRERSQASEYSGYGSPSRSARSTPALCENCILLREQTDKLKEINKIFTDKIKKFENDSLNNQTKARTLSEVESKCQDLQTQIQSLNNINSLMTEKVSRLEREKAEALQNVPAPGEVISRVEFDQLEREKDRLRGDYTDLKEDYTSLKTDYGNLKSTFTEIEGLHRELASEKALQPTRTERDQLESNVRKAQQENDALQRQLELLRSQALIAENAKMRAEDKIRILEKEIEDMQKQVSQEKAKSRRASLGPDVEFTLKIQLEERNQIIQQLQSDIASKNIAMENLRQGVDNRVMDKIRELEDVLRERDDLDEARRRLDQQKLALEIKLEEQKLIIEQLRDEKPRLMQDKDAQIDRLDRQKTKLENDLMNLKNKLSEKDSQLLRLQMQQGSQLDNLQEESSKQIRDLQTLILKKESENVALQEIINEKDQDSREFANTKSRLDLELGQIQGESARKTEHLTDIVQRQEGEITGLREEITRKNDLLRTMKQNQDSDVNNFKDMLSETTREFTRYKDSKSREVDDLRSRLSESSEESDKLLERKEERIRSLQQELDEVREETPLMNQSLNSVEHELALVRGELQRVNGMITVKEAQIQEQDRRLQMAEMKHEEAVRDRNEQRRTMQKEMDEREDTITDLQRQLDVVKSEVSIHEEQADKTKRLEDRITSQEEEISTLSKQTREMKGSNRTLTEETNIQKREIEKLKISANSKCNKCERTKAEKEEVTQEKESLEEEVDELQQEVDRLESLLNVYQQDNKSYDTKPKLTKTPVKEEIVTPIRRNLVDAARSSTKTYSMTSSPSSRHSSRSASPSPARPSSSTVNPMKLAAAMKRLSQKPGDSSSSLKNSLKPSDALQKRTASPRSDILRSSARESPFVRSLAETTPSASANSSRRSSVTSLEQADRQRALSPEPSGPASKDRRHSVLDMPKKPYHEENRNSLNTLEARLKSLQASSKAKKATLETGIPGPAGDAKKKQTRFVLPSSKKFDKGAKP